MKARSFGFVALLMLAVQISAHVVGAQSVVLPHDVQGAGATSPQVGNTLTVRGVITANASDGFFIQTATGDDGNPNTSEGLFVAGMTSAGAGTVVDVTGTVEEFADFGAGTVTRLVGVTDVLEVGTAVLPDPILLTDVELSPTGSPDQLERFEGMRVTTASLRSVSATRSDGSFYVVVHDPASPDARPFREPGIEVGAPALPCAIGPCAFQSFDGNPERLRVDSDKLASTVATQLSVGSVITNVSGLLHFEMGDYTLLPEFTLTDLVPPPSEGMAMRAAPVTGADEYSIASLNLGAEPEDQEEADEQLAKASALVRTVLNAPDIIGVQRADAATLNALAARIDQDASDAGETVPGYVAQLDGFLVKASRVTVVSADVVGADQVFQGAPLFDRAPVMLRGVVFGSPAMVPQPLTVLNGELRSIADVGGADAAGDNARAHRRAQAEWLAGFVQTRNDLNDALVLVGNFNAHAFNDGYVDVMGTVSGTPAPADQVVLESPDLVTPDLANLAGGLLIGERYSSVARGSAQSFDHTLVSDNLVAQVRGFAFARVHADFPAALRGLSDRDPSVAYFAFPPDSTAPQFDSTPPDQTVEATGPDGAIVTFTVPTATDNLDGSVPVTCVPASGSTFPVGTTTVDCTATDSAGNVGRVQFRVTVTRSAPAPTAGRMFGAGLLKSGANRVTFAFDVKRSANDHSRGWLLLMVTDGRGRHSFLTVPSVQDVAFSNPRGTATFGGFAFWNGRPGYRFEVTAHDHGSHGGRGDTFSVVVKAPNGAVVVSASGLISVGKITQAR